VAFDIQLTHGTVKVVFIYLSCKQPAEVSFLCLFLVCTELRCVIMCCPAVAHGAFSSTHVSLQFVKPVLHKVDLFFLLHDHSDV
jgi:hypothetical protein